MSVAILKLIASLGMLIDHLGSVLGESGWDFFNSETTYAMRTIGRFVFPVFAFLITNGWHYTKNKQNYFSNLMLFALISQAPYTLATHSVNREKIAYAEGPNYFPDTRTFYLYIGISLLFTFSYWYFALKKKPSLSLIWVFFAPLLFALPLKWHYIWFIYFELNVMYTLAIGMFAIYCYEKVFIDRDLKWYEYLLLLGTLLVAIRTIGNNSDYGFLGILLVFAIYLVQQSRAAQALVIALWGIYFYGIQYSNWPHAWSVVLLSASLILLYNGKKGANLKYFFYIFYPGHLLVLGILNVILRYS